ncbi:hypothetical protein A2761_00620 [Candidatus Kaiserbacteria bacterium RIFCSPHIGHO2_01_FULL_51_33]|uniref:Transglycosylase SLT domain-containing protein n=1 Tax=Candidatus Kaiserbacteria bacterium RIFCSPLOWO2_01_FULL_51_21 TaxID=1798508 RepID=A0A1F6ED45_9BACT|nr:MAG: hypothetical protein A2761_00620 [Candidatus Kaiserbacteria bacterium RIFCSPHIGHO2_01_FULL_51_33]OGG71530.1 MAG: hypothetical protein A3A35_02980 [Candidatus Kaiserbacteria bacterium RIFCSPLOWO2_01_FULL_51_21]
MRKVSDGMPTVVSLAAALLIGMSLFQAAYAQTADSSAVQSRRAELQTQLQQVEAEIDQQKKLLTGKQQESVSLERDINILNAKIKTAQLSIKARDLTILQLGDDISAKQVAINGLSEKLDREKDSLAQLIRRTADIDSYPYIAVVLGNGSLSEVFEDLDTFSSLQQALRDSFDEIEETKTVTAVQKNVLEDKRAEEVQLRQLQVLEQKKIESQQAEKKRILTVSKGVEALYQQLIKSKEKSAAQIRTELFTLSGSAAIPFEKALEYATKVGNATGVRPALILGIIAEESNLGENVGTGFWRTDMHPTRDQPVFERLTSELGLDPDKMPVSKKPWYGWGGAMGPAQFIPSTWVLYKERVAKATGHNPPNPWNPEDAFAAAAILLADNGATKQTPAAERLAALRYLAGWTNATKRAYAFYGDDVMELADKYQNQINVLLAIR